MFKNEKNGFTLLELTIALAIMGIMLTPVIGMFAGATFSTFRGSIETQGIIMAQARMEEFKYMGFNYIEEKILAGQARVVIKDTAGLFEREVSLEKMDITVDGDLPGGGHGLIYIQPTGGHTNFIANVIFIKVGIAWREGGSRHFVSVSSYLSPR